MQRISKTFFLLLILMPMLVFSTPARLGAGYLQHNPKQILGTTTGNEWRSKLLLDKNLQPGGRDADVPIPTDNWFAGFLYAPKQQSQAYLSAKPWSLQYSALGLSVSIPNISIHRSENGVSPIIQEDNLDELNIMFAGQPVNSRMRLHAWSTLASTWALRDKKSALFMTVTQGSPYLQFEFYTPKGEAPRPIQIKEQVDSVAGVTAIEIGRAHV